MSTSREEVYAAIDSEREYQKKWDTAESSGKHEAAAWILFMEQYLQEAREIESKAAAEDVRGKVLSKIRCVAALGVACMEQHGAPKR